MTPAPTGSATKTCDFIATDVADGEVRGIQPGEDGRSTMSYPLGLEVKDLKSTPCQVIDEVMGHVRCVSPTARHDPLTGTAAFSPLGYMQIQGTREYRRVYP